MPLPAPTPAAGRRPDRHRPGGRVEAAVRHRRSRSPSRTGLGSLEPPAAPATSPTPTRRRADRRAGHLRPGLGRPQLDRRPWNGRSWTGGTWMGRSWTGDTWWPPTPGPRRLDRSSWTGRSWTGRSWTGAGDRRPSLGQHHHADRHHRPERLTDMPASRRIEAAAEIRARRRRGPTTSRLLAGDHRRRHQPRTRAPRRSRDGRQPRTASSRSASTADGATDSVIWSRQGVRDVIIAAIELTDPASPWDPEDPRLAD